MSMRARHNRKRQSETLRECMRSRESNRDNIERDKKIVDMKKRERVRSSSSCNDTE